MTERNPYFQMWAPELNALARQGDERAQAELDRRAAKRYEERPEREDEDEDRSTSR